MTSSSPETSLSEQRVRELIVIDEWPVSHMLPDDQERQERIEHATALRELLILRARLETAMRLMMFRQRCDEFSIEPSKEHIATVRDFLKGED